MATSMLRTFSLKSIVATVILWQSVGFAADCQATSSAWFLGQDGHYKVSALWPNELLLTCPDRELSSPNLGNCFDTVKTNFVSEFVSFKKSKSISLNGGRFEECLKVKCGERVRFNSANSFQIVDKSGTYWDLDPIKASTEDVRCSRDGDIYVISSTHIFDYSLRQTSVVLRWKEDSEIRYRVRNRFNF